MHDKMQGSPASASQAQARSSDPTISHVLHSTRWSWPLFPLKMTCQKCRAPLKLDQSLENLNAAAFDLLIGMYALHPKLTFAQLCQAPPDQRKKRRVRMYRRILLTLRKGKKHMSKPRKMPGRQYSRGRCLRRGGASGQPRDKAI